MSSEGVSTPLSHSACHCAFTQSLSLILGLLISQLTWKMARPAFLSLLSPPSDMDGKPDFLHGF